uniref:M15 family metallopeptidase n=1 Tax=uncultured Sphingomonas sp. TaxID=158754 RepID=UPI0025ED276C
GRLTTPQSIVKAAQADAAGPADMGDRFFGAPLPDTAWTAPERLKAPLHFKSEAYMRQVRRADWSFCDVRLVVWAAQFQMMAKQREIPLYVHAALRSKAVQDAHRRNGTSKVKYPNSAHNIGEAVDVVHGTYHWDLNKAEWNLLHALGRLALDRVNTRLKAADKLSLTWGGHFKTLYDPAHWEISDYRHRTRELPEPLTPLHRSPVEVMRFLTEGRYPVFA